MKSIAFLSIALTILSFRSISCIQYYMTDSSGERHYFEGRSRAPTEIDKLVGRETYELQKFGISVTAEEQHKYISNYCAALIKLGRYKDAIPILENLLKAHPGEYEIIANLAVALELNGQLDEALVFLKKSMTLNHNSHNGSEWFHLRVLEAAIDIRDKKLNLQEMDVLKIQKNTQAITQLAIAYQLHERIPLTKSTNSLLSKVIEECGDFYYSHYSIEWAIDFYAMAIGYTADNAVETRLWRKISLSRDKLLSFKKKPDNYFRYLNNSRWKDEIGKKIKEWRGYTPYYYNGEIKKEFQAS